MTPLSNTAFLSSCRAIDMIWRTPEMLPQPVRGRLVRPRPASRHAVNDTVARASGNTEDKKSNMPPPVPKRSVRADIDTQSLNVALRSLSQQAPGEVEEPKPFQGRHPTRECTDDRNAARQSPGVVRKEGAAVHLLGEVQRLSSRGNVAEAVALLVGTASPRKRVTSTVETLTSVSEASPRAVATAPIGNDIRGETGDSKISDESLRAGFITVLKGCAKRGMWEEAGQIVVKHIPAAGLQTPMEAWIIAIDACAGERGAQQAVYLLHEMRSRGVEITVVAYEAAVKACACSGGITRAIFLLKDASKRGMPVRPTAVAETISAVTKRRRSCWQQALSLYDAFVQLVVDQEQEPASQRGNGADALNGTDSLPSAVRRLHRLSESGSLLEEVCHAALAACAAGGQWERAREVLDTMRAGRTGGKLSTAAYDKTIDVCGQARAWDMVLLLAAEMRADDVALSPATFETALQACAAIGSWSWARSLLLSARAGGKDRVLLTSKHYIHALSACAGVVGKPGGAEAQGAMKFALALIQDLRDAGWLKEQQGEDAYVLAMQTCVRAQDAWSALALLDNSEDDGIPEGPALRSAAMQALSGAGEWRAALSILDRVLKEGEQPGGAMYIAAMAACARGGVSDLALELLERVLVEYPGDKEIVTAAYHGAITACAECGQWEKATSLLQQMRQDSLAVVTIAEYNAAILACCRARQSFAALSLLGDMFVDGGIWRPKGSGSQKNGLRPNEMSYNLVMRAFAQEGRWQTVMDLILSMRDEGGLVPGVSSYNIVVDSLARAGEWQQALRVLEEMKSIGVRPTEFTYNCCMTACEKSGRWEETMSVMRDMKKQGDLVPDSYAFSIAMMACSKAGRLDDVLNILQEIRSIPGGRGPNLVNYNIAIGTCARFREWERMLKEMDKMKWEDVTPTETTFLGPLDTCARSGELSVALTLLARMRESGISPGMGSYTSAVAAACRADDARAASKLLDEMSAAGHVADEVTYAMASVACRDGASADAAVDLLRRMKLQQLPPDPVVSGFVVQACCAAGDVKRGLGVIREMRKDGLVPDVDFYNGVLAGISATFAVDPGN